MPSWIGPWEIAIVLVIALVVFGPKKLPELGSSLGKSIRGFRKALQESQEEVKSAVAEVRQATGVDEVKSTVAEVRQATGVDELKSTVADLRDAVGVQGVKDALSLKTDTNAETAAANPETPKTE